MPKTVVQRKLSLLCAGTKVVAQAGGVGSEDGIFVVVDCLIEVVDGFFEVVDGVVDLEVVDGVVKVVDGVVVDVVVIFFGIYQHALSPEL